MALFDFLNFLKFIIVSNHIGRDVTIYVSREMRFRINTNFIID